MKASKHIRPVYRAARSGIACVDEIDATIAVQPVHQRNFAAAEWAACIVPDSDFGHSLIAKCLARAPDIVISRGPVLVGIVTVSLRLRRCGAECETGDKHPKGDQNMEYDQLAVVEPCTGSQAEDCRPHHP